MGSSCEGSLSCTLLLGHCSVDCRVDSGYLGFLGYTTSKMVKTAKEKTIHKAMRSADKFYNEIPAFADVFDEDTWYQFCFMFVCCTIVCVFLLSRYIDIRSQDPLDRDHKGVKLKKKTAPVKGASAEEQKCFFKDE